MSRPTFVIFARENGGFDVAGASQRQTIDAPQSGGIDAAADAIATTLKQLGHAGQGVVLAIPSSWCLSANVVDDVPKKNRRTALLYKLEEQLPVAAEDVVADFIGAGQTCLGVCCETRVLKPVLDAIESRGVVVQSIIPAATLLAQELIVRGVDGPMLLVGDETGVSLFDLAVGAIVNWTLLPHDPSAIVRAIQQSALTRGTDLRASAVAVGPEIVEQLRSAGIEIVFDDRSDATSIIVSGADAILRGRYALVELRRDALGAADAMRAIRGPLNAALAAAIVLLLVLTVALYVRGNRYRAQAAELDDAQRSLYLETFPGTRVPASVPSRLKAVRRDLEQRTGGGGSTEVPSASALRTLWDVLAAMPPDVSVELVGLDFTDQAFTLEGVIDSYERADAIAGAIRLQSGYEVPPYSAVRQDDGRYRVTLTGTRSAATEAGTATTGGIDRLVASGGGGRP